MENLLSGSFIVCISTCKFNTKEMTYKTINLNEPKCYIWFFEDVSHLLKTARNCIYHLSNGNGTGFMWKERNFILWDRLYKILDQNGRLLLILVSRIQCFLDLKCTICYCLCQSLIDDSLPKFFDSCLTTSTHGRTVPKSRSWI